MRCANSEAESRYQDSVQKAEENFQEFLSAVDEQVKGLIEEAKEKYESLAKDFNIEDYSFSAYIDEI